VSARLLRNASRALLLLACGVAVSGCAHRTGLYTWGGYDDLLYNAYKDPSSASAMKSQLEANVAYVEGHHERVAPGLYAEIGTLYLSTGDKANAARFFHLESEHWPESRPFMERLIAHLDTVTPAAAPAAAAASSAASASAATPAVAVNTVPTGAAR
jgi:hypothetical protein